MAPVAEAVDYLSYEFNIQDLHSCWRNATKHKDQIINGRRLENASWRKFFQMKFNLKTADPSILNWQKDNDVCWLYGPFFSYEPLPVIEAAALERDLAEKANMMGANIAKDAAALAADGTPLRPALKKRKEKDDIWLALREKYLANGGNLRPEDLQAFASRDPSPPAPTGRGALFYLSDFPSRYVSKEGMIPRVTSETWTSAKWDRVNPWDQTTATTTTANTRVSLVVPEETSPIEEDESSSPPQQSQQRGRSSRTGKKPRVRTADSPDSIDSAKHIRFSERVEVNDLLDSAEEPSPREESSIQDTPKRNIVGLKKPMFDQSESETDDEPDYFVAKGSKFDGIENRGNSPIRGISPSPSTDTPPSSQPLPQQPLPHPSSAISESLRRRLSTPTTAEDSDDENEGLIYINVRKSPNLSIVSHPSEHLPSGPAVPAALTYANSSGNLGGLKRTTSTGKLSLALQQATQVQQDRLNSAPATLATFDFPTMQPAAPGSYQPPTNNSTSIVANAPLPILPILKHTSEQTGQEPTTSLPSPPPSSAGPESTGNSPAVREDEDESYVSAHAPEEYTVGDRVNDVLNNAYEVARWLGAAVSSGTTGFYGLPVHPNPRPVLISLYQRILHTSQRLPQESVYRQSAESLAKHRLTIVEKEEDVSKIEAQINAGQVEELIKQAEDELALIPKMEAWKVWEPLETPPEEGQWKGF
ncbi:hypothetical protein SmJEL517_g00402 [Synchytrium microbalum]|uniref:Nitrogen regulatory protein areA GATA-like domain-containing protein n=1 Tax=Synchytrium microbalum TaxID=1806994 RepID=A0A507CFM5_9FUNG|nr:uncharacterized protein SmJEL517_g00402 [Synchytrium microbalum]TPX37979.1 hypothetical protein SmJEL517_g00402 [Synchytrium microbalum]